MALVLEYLSLSSHEHSHRKMCFINDMVIHCIEVSLLVLDKMKKNHFLLSILLSVIIKKAWT